MRTCHKHGRAFVLEERDYQLLAERVDEVYEKALLRDALVRERAPVGR